MMTFSISKLSYRADWWYVNVLDALLGLDLRVDPSSSCSSGCGGGGRILLPTARWGVWTAAAYR